MTDETPTCIDCDGPLFAPHLCNACRLILLREPLGTPEAPSRFMLYARRGWLR